MTTALEERVERLEQTVEPLTTRVKQLETWAGPGQNETFATNLADLRKRLDNFGKVQSKHTRMLSVLTKDVAGLKTDVAGLKTDVATLKTDVATLKTDMVEVKGALSEILDRLPPRPQTPGK